MGPDTQDTHLPFGNPVTAEAQAGPRSEIECSQKSSPGGQVLIHASPDFILN